MKTVYFESLRNSDKFYCTDLKDVRTIDGVEYLRVFRIGTQRDCLVKKDSIRRMPEKK